jgi:hypothetical protein
VEACQEEAAVGDAGAAAAAATSVEEALLSQAAVSCPPAAAGAEGTCAADLLVAAAAAVKLHTEPVTAARADSPDPKAGVRAQKFVSIPPGAGPSAAGAAVNSAPSSVLDTFTPWVGFSPGAVEVQYKMFKHQVTLSSDYGCAVFCLAFILGLLVRMVRSEQDRWNTFGYMMYLGFKLVAYVPLLLGYKEVHFR